MRICRAKGLGFFFLSHIASRVFSDGLRFVSHGYMVPHPEKLSKGGEDYVYFSERVVAVADGVGGWAQHGIDSRNYSKKLCDL